MKEYYLVSKSSLFDDYRKNIAIFNERKLAEEYVSKRKIPDVMKFLKDRRG